MAIDLVKESLRQFGEVCNGVIRTVFDGHTKAHYTQLARLQNSCYTIVWKCMYIVKIISLKSTVAVVYKQG